MSRRYLFSGSKLPLVAKCRAAGVLPRVSRLGDRDRIGNALHEHAKDRVYLGLPGAVERLPEVAAAWGLDERETSIFVARARHFEFTPPRGTFAEVALCLCDDGSVAPVVGGRGVYERLPPNGIIPTQIDLFWAEPEPLYRETLPDGTARARCPPESILYVGDYKTGLETYVDDVERNLQTALGCVLAAEWTGAKFAIPAIIYWRKGKGLWDVPEAPFGPEQLATLKAAIRQLHAECVDVETALREGRPVQYTTGPHCEFCDSEVYCSAKTAGIKRYLDDPSPLAAAQLTREQAVAAARLYGQIGRFHKAIGESLKAWTEEHGVLEVSPGKGWGPYSDPTSELDPEIAHAALVDEIGNAAADAAFTLDTSKAAMERAIKTAHRERGIERQGAAAMRRVLGSIRAKGGFVDGVKIKYGLHSLSGRAADPFAITVAPEVPRAAAADYSGIPIDGDD